MKNLKLISLIAIQIIISSSLTFGQTSKVKNDVVGYWLNSSLENEATVDDSYLFRPDMTGTNTLTLIATMGSCPIKSVVKSNFTYEITNGKLYITFKKAEIKVVLTSHSSNQETEEACQTTASEIENDQKEADSKISPFYGGKYLVLGNVLEFRDRVYKKQ